MFLERSTEQTHVQSLGFVSYLVGKYYIEYHTKLKNKTLTPVYIEDLSPKNDYSRLLITIGNMFEMIITDGLHLNTVIHKLIGKGTSHITASWLIENGFTYVSRKTTRYQLFIERGDYETDDTLLEVKPDDA